MGRIVSSIRLESVPTFFMGPRARYTHQEQQAIMAEEKHLLKCIDRGSVPVNLAARHMKLVKQAAGIYTASDDGAVWMREGDNIIRIDEDLSWIKSKPHTTPKRTAGMTKEEAVDPHDPAYAIDWRVFYFNALEALRRGDANKAYEWLVEYNDATDDTLTLDDLKADLEGGGMEEMRSEFQRTQTPLPKTAQQADVSTATGAGPRNIDTPGDYDMPQDHSQSTGQHKHPHQLKVRRRKLMRERSDGHSLNPHPERADDGW